MKEIAAQRLPFDLREKYRTRMIRYFPTEHCQMVNTPGNYHINTQARLKTVSSSQLPILYPAAAFEGTVYISIPKAVKWLAYAVTWGEPCA